jgi:hypothetical protein
MQNPTYAANPAGTDAPVTNAPARGPLARHQWCEIPANAPNEAHRLARLADHIRDVSSGIETVFTLLSACLDDLGERQTPLLNNYQACGLLSLARRSVDSLNCEAERDHDYLENAYGTGSLPEDGAE